DSISKVQELIKRSLPKYGDSVLGGERKGRERRKKAGDRGLGELLARVKQSGSHPQPYPVTSSSSWVQAPSERNYLSTLQALQEASPRKEVGHMCWNCPLIKPGGYSQNMPITAPRTPANRLPQQHMLPRASGSQPQM
ncbi:hypothetical protein HAX54_008995, partial [Datura stramonium]|nr:hypothetical protein [Datura stramonium]